jgi:transcription termination factor Rho
MPVRKSSATRSNVTGSSRGSNGSNGGNTRSRSNSRGTNGRSARTLPSSSSSRGSQGGGAASSGYDSGNHAPQNSQNDNSGYYTGDTISIEGALEILQDYGVIRQDAASENLPKDVYISHSQIRRFSLRKGDIIKGQARPPKESERYLSLLKIEMVSGKKPEEARKRPRFEKLTAIFPTDWLKLETDTETISTRLIDLVSPIGRGQRTMLVAPPKAGKTWLLKDIANGLTTNYPELILLVALIGERPEEVTHFSRSVKGEVFASNFDERAEDQTRVAELCLDRAKRLVEEGSDVVILMDSITRLARAYNMVAPPSGRTLTGGFDPAALYPTKHFFGAARNLEEGGSLTIIGTALVETGSRMDDVIFEEFKGTGNMELKLDRSLANKRVYPAIDIKNSSTRHEEMLYEKKDLESIVKFRRMIDLLDDREVTELVIGRLKKSKTNREFLDNLHKGA